MKGSVQKYNYLMVQLQKQQMLLAKKKSLADSSRIKRQHSSTVGVGPPTQGST